MKQIVYYINLMQVYDTSVLGINSPITMTMVILTVFTLARGIIPLELARRLPLSGFFEEKRNIDMIVTLIKTAVGKNRVRAL